MSREIRADYQQELMFPPRLEDWVPQDHPARFIRDLVDSMDLEAMGFRVSDDTESKVGRPSYASDLLLKAWLYGYLNRIHSSRRLEKACREHMALVWLTGMHEPDHNSLWRFMKFNKKAVAELFKKSVRVAVSCNLVGMVLHAVDGTKIPTISSREEVRTPEGLERLQEKMDRSVADFMTEIERNEASETGDYRLPQSMYCAFKRKDEIQKALREIQESGQEKVHHKEPEARFMKNRRSIELSYNAQAVADESSGIVVAQDVVNEETDNGQLVPMLDRVQETLGKTADNTAADTGYFSSAQIGLAEERGYGVLVNAPSSETTDSRSPACNPYHTARFRYDEERNCCICPHGQELVYMKTRVRGRNANEVKIYQCRAYRTCPYREGCSKDKRGRKVEISVHYKALERQRARREACKELLSRRKTIIEPVFAWIKRHLGFRRWTVFGLERVKTQWAFVCTIVNIKKLYTQWVSGGLRLTAA
jgi:transposase